MDEFDLIAAHFAPLADPQAALDLLDDAAYLQGPGDLVITADALVEGVHFLPTDPLETVARKLARVNFSDLIAKGAEPIGALLTLAWPKRRPTAQIADFARGLALEQSNGLTLLGGDTVSTPGPLTISLTMLGSPCAGGPVLRAGARPGDLVCVTGVIGDGYLGLNVATGEAMPLDATWLADLLDAYRVPRPPFGFAPALAAHASAALDVSDGLIADAGRLAKRSGVALTIEAERVPLSAAARAWRSAADDPVQALGALVTGGDDYQTLFTIAPDRLDGLRAAARGIAVSVIGRAEAGSGVRLVDSTGAILAAARQGWSHF
jgi:thiamine-monophosphate kinase